MKFYLKEAGLPLVLLVIDLLLILFYVLCRVVFINVWIMLAFLFVTIAAIVCVKDKEKRRKCDVVNLLLCLAADVIFVGFYICAITGTLERLSGS